MRQRKNALCYTSEQRAESARILPSGIATCVQAGGKALDSLVAIQDHRHLVFAKPGAWAPWTEQAALVPAERTGRQSGAHCARAGAPLPQRTGSSQAESVTLWGLTGGHQGNRRWDSRLVHSPKPWPSSAKSWSVGPARGRNPETAPFRGLSPNPCRHTAASPAMPLRPVRGSPARKLRLCGGSWSLSALPARRAARAPTPGRLPDRSCAGASHRSAGPRPRPAGSARGE